MILNELTGSVQKRQGVLLAQ